MKIHIGFKIPFGKGARRRKVLKDLDEVHERLMDTRTRYYKLTPSEQAKTERGRLLVTLMAELRAKQGRLVADLNRHF